MAFQLYSGGVLTARCGTNLDHGVLLVGYGVSEDSIKYWKVTSVAACSATFVFAPLSAVVRCMLSTQFTEIYF